jgi:hypothetical protein
MSKKQSSGASKSANSQAEVLRLLQDVLPKTVSDQKLAEKIYSACEKEIAARSRLMHFEKFCAKAELPDLNMESIEEIQRQFEESFGKGRVSVVPHEKKQAATVEVVLNDQVLEGVIKVGTDKNGNEEGEQEFKPKFVPFPVSLETDPELVWVLGRGENLTPQEAAVALSKANDEFWASRQGQQLLRKRVERSFPEFIRRVPSKFLGELGLKRHYKEPEPLKQIKPERARP